jgi:hypothetical protein
LGRLPLAVPYVGVTHGGNRSGRATRATALGIAIADPVVTALACSVTGGHDISIRSST